jgi:hypothetical protein
MSRAAVVVNPVTACAAVVAQPGALLLRVTQEPHD